MQVGASPVARPRRAQHLDPDPRRCAVPGLIPPPRGPPALNASRPPPPRSPFNDEKEDTFRTWWGKKTYSLKHGETCGMDLMCAPGFHPAVGHVSCDTGTLAGAENYCVPDSCDASLQIVEEALGNGHAPRECKRGGKMALESCGVTNSAAFLADVVEAEADADCECEPQCDAGYSIGDARSSTEDLPTFTVIPPTGASFSLEAGKTETEKKWVAKKGGLPAREVAKFMPDSNFYDRKTMRCVAGCALPRSRRRTPRRAALHPAPSACISRRPRRTQPPVRPQVRRRCVRVHGENAAAVCQRPRHVQGRAVPQRDHVRRGVNQPPALQGGGTWKLLA